MAQVEQLEDMKNSQRISPGQLQRGIHRRIWDNNIKADVMKRTCQVVK
jgi:hypothetical protein